jgi:pyruvate dehydrogenase E2 component (dihydrolipoamide acetyltransferase)
VSSLFEFPLPDIGEGVAEGEIVEWKVNAGDAVKEDQVLLEVMTDKATVEISSPVRGTVRELVVKAGEVAPVGAVLCRIEPAAGAHVPTIAAHGGGHAAPAKKEAAKAPAAEATTAAAPAAKEFSRPAGQRALATPYTRKMARELGVDIEKIEGTGDVGRVTEDDVKTFAAGTKAPAKAAAKAAPAKDGGEIPVPKQKGAPSLSEQIADQRPAAPKHVPAPIPHVPGGETRTPIRGLRKKISERMRASKTTAAHFTYVDDVDVTELVALRAKMKDRAAKRGVKLTYMPFIAKALVSALQQFPTLNAVTDDAAGEFVVKHYYNFGIAVDTDQGLIVPVVKDVDKRSLLDLASELDRVAGEARDGKSKLEDLKDGTFTITNAGNIGGLFATPIINYPEAAILGVHAIKKTPRVVGDKIEIRDVMYLSISIDHRMNDGATGARFMNHVASMLQDPQQLILEM